MGEWDFSLGVNISSYNFMINALVDETLSNGSKFSDICTGANGEMFGWFRPNGYDNSNVNTSTNERSM